MSTNELQIRYSGSCNYSKLAAAFEEKVKKANPDLKIDSQSVPCISGAFEVAIKKGKNLDMLFSNLNGQGPLNNEKLEKILQSLK